MKAERAPAFLSGRYEFLDTHGTVQVDRKAKKYVVKALEMAVLDVLDLFTTSETADAYFGDILESFPLELF